MAAGETLTWKTVAKLILIQGFSAAFLNKKQEKTWLYGLLSVSLRHKREVLPDLKKRRQRYSPEAQLKVTCYGGLLTVWIKGKFGDVFGVIRIPSGCAGVARFFMQYIKPALIWPQGAT